MTRMDPFEFHSQLKTGASTDASSLGRFGEELYPFDASQADPAFISKQLAAAHKPVHLIVGRGFGDAWWISSQPNEPVLRIDDATALTVYCDRFGGAFRNTATIPLHLWMDFSLPLALANLSSNIFTDITIDWSTWRYMRPMIASISHEWRRISQTNSRFTFEGGIASYKITPGTKRSGQSDSDESKDGDVCDEISWEFDNPCHVCVCETTVRKWLAKCAIQRVSAQSSAGVELGIRRDEYRPPRLHGRGSRLAHLKQETSLVNAQSRSQPVIANLETTTSMPGLISLPLNERRIISAPQDRKLGIHDIQVFKDHPDMYTSIQWLEAVIWTFASPLADAAIIDFFKSRQGGSWPHASIYIGDPYPIATRGRIPRWIRLSSIKDS